MANYRNKKILASARDECCTMCGVHDGTVVAAHSNSQRHGKGMGIKAHDCFIAYLCARCHDWYDGRVNWTGTREAKQEKWQQAHERTLAKLKDKGLIDDEVQRVCLLP